MVVGGRNGRSDKRSHLFITAQFPGEMDVVVGGEGLQMYHIEHFCITGG